jgi:hypothetical protein
MNYEQLSTYRAIYVVYKEEIISEYLNGEDRADFAKIIIDPNGYGIQVHTSIFECQRRKKIKTTVNNEGKIFHKDLDNKNEEEIKINNESKENNEGKENNESKENKEKMEETDDEILLKKFNEEIKNENNNFLDLGKDVKIIKKVESEDKLSESEDKTDSNLTSPRNNNTNNNNNNNNNNEEKEKTERLYKTVSKEVLKKSFMGKKKTIVNKIIPILTTTEILNDLKARKYLKVFMASLFQTENIIFYEEVENYKKLNDEERKIRANEMYNTFFEKDAGYELNVNQKQKTNILNGLENYSVNLYDSVLKEIIVLLDDSCNEFKKSKLYNELFDDNKTDYSLNNFNLKNLMSV